MVRDSGEHGLQGGGQGKTGRDPTFMAQRLREARLAVGLSQTEAAKRAGVSNVSIYRCERGLTTPRRSTLARLAPVYRRSPEWLMDETVVGAGADWPLPPDAGPGIGFHVELVAVPVVAGMAGAGHKVFEETPRDWEPCRRDRLESSGADPRHCRLVQVLGTAMAPTVPAGSLVMVDLACRDLEDGRIFLITDPNEGVGLRRAFEDGANWLVAADNPAWGPRPYAPGWAVHGQALWCHTLLG